MDSFGEYLKRERELREISLEEIRDYTKINIRFLKALETDKFDLMPGKFFTRGIIRSYASYIGLDVRDVLDKYNELFLKKSPPEEKRAEEEEKVDETKPLLKAKILIWALVIIVLISASVFLYYKYGKKQTQVSQIAILEETEVPKTEEKIIPEITKDKIEQGLQLEFNVDQKTWFQIYADGELIVDGIKEAGDTFQVSAEDEVIMHVGNAGGFTYSINGNQGKSLGLPGQVIRDVLIQVENYKNFLKEDPDAPMPFPELDKK